MGTPDEIPGGVRVPVVWLGPEEVPILHANAFVSQFDPETLDTLLLTVGQLTPPVIAGATEEEREAQARAVTFVAVKPVVRLALSQARVRELIATLEANLDQLDVAIRVRQGDPRAE